MSLPRYPLFVCCLAAPLLTAGCSAFLNFDDLSGDDSPALYDASGEMELDASVDSSNDIAIDSPQADHPSPESAVTDGPSDSVSPGDALDAEDAPDAPPCDTQPIAHAEPSHINVHEPRMVGFQNALAAAWSNANGSVLFRLLSSTAQPLGSTVSFPRSVSHWARSPAIAAADNQVAIAYVDDDTRQVMFNMLNDQGTPLIASDLQVSNLAVGNGATVAVAWNPASREWGVAWPSEQGLAFVRVNESGSIVSQPATAVAPFPSATSADYAETDLAWVGSRFAVLWTPYRGPSDHLVVIDEIEPDGQSYARMSDSGGSFGGGALAWNRTQEYGVFIGTWFMRVQVGVGVVANSVLDVDLTLGVAGYSVQPGISSGDQGYLVTSVIATGIPSALVAAIIRHDDPTTVQSPKLIGMRADSDGSVGGRTAVVAERCRFSMSYPFIEDGSSTSNLGVSFLPPTL